MAAAAHVTVNVYGTVAGQPPFQTVRQINLQVSFPIFWATPGAMSFPTTGTVFHPVNPGVQVGNTSNYIYSIVEVQPTGLNVNSAKYASNQSVATLATNAG
jgi:hypothetical protein